MKRCAEIAVQYFSPKLAVTGDVAPSSVLQEYLLISFAISPSLFPPLLCLPASLSSVLTISLSAFSVSSVSLLSLRVQKTRGLFYSLSVRKCVLMK